MAVLQRLGLIVFGTLLACLGVETVLRVWDAVPEVGSPLDGFHEADPDLGWRGTPNVTLRYHRPEFDTLVRHDAGGWRLADPPRPANPSQRILVLGDSFTWGWGVSQGEVFTDRVQARLPPSVAVYNRGVIGFGTAQEYLLLQRELAATRYDTVVLTFFVNDLADNSDGKDGYRPYFELVDGALQPRNQPALARPSPADRFLHAHSRAYRFIAFEIGLVQRHFAGEAADERGYRDVAVGDPHDLPGYAVTARLLAEMNRLAGAHGARFFVVYVPQRSQFQLDSSYPYVRAVRSMIGEITAREGIPLIDLTPPFRRATAAGHELVFAIDAHWNAAGHQLAADVLLASPIFRAGQAAPLGRDAHELDGERRRGEALPPRIRDRRVDVEPDGAHSGRQQRHTCPSARPTRRPAIPASRSCTSTPKAR